MQFIFALFLLLRIDLFRSEVVLLGKRHLRSNFISLREGLLLLNLIGVFNSWFVIYGTVLHLLLRIELFLIKFNLSRVVIHLLFRSLRNAHIIHVIKSRGIIIIEAVILLILGLEENFIFILSKEEGSFTFIEDLIVCKIRVSTVEFTVFLDLLFFIVFIERTQNVKDFVFINIGLSIETILVEGLRI